MEGMMRRKIKNWFIIAGVALGLLLIFQISKKIIMSGAKAVESVITVSGIPLVEININEMIRIQGIVDGDPQIKVYPQVPGKFISNAVTDGDKVRKGQAVSYIDRDQVGFHFKPAPVKAPISGIVTKLYYTDKGSAVNPVLPVAEVANADKIKVVLSMGENDLAKIKKNQKALLVPPADSAALAKAINCLLDNTDERSRLACAGLERVNSVFSWEKAARDVVSVYREAIDGYR